MEKSTKIIVTVVIVVVFFFLMALVGFLSESAGRSTPGILGIVVAFVFIAALRAIWKKPKNDNDNLPKQN